MLLSRSNKINLPMEKNKMKNKTEQEDKMEVREMQFERLQKEIDEINGYQDQPRINIELITSEHALGREYLGMMFGKLEQDHLHGGFEDTLVENRLFDRIADRITSLRRNGREPTAFSVDAIQTFERTNYNRGYAYAINFYGGEK